MPYLHGGGTRKRQLSASGTRRCVALFSTTSIGHDQEPEWIWGGGLTDFRFRDDQSLASTACVKTITGGDVLQTGLEKMSEPKGLVGSLLPSSDAPMVSSSCGGQPEGEGVALDRKKVLEGAAGGVAAPAGSEWAEPDWDELKLEKPEEARCPFKILFGVKEGLF